MSDNMKTELNELYEQILKLKTVTDCDNFFADLCTYEEINSMAQRLKAARLLMDGDTYEQVIAKTDISSATLSRVSKCVKLGKGYKSVLKEEK